jgi:hypothetical protein
MCVSEQYSFLGENVCNTDLEREGKKRETNTETSTSKEMIGRKGNRNRRE